MKNLRLLVLAMSLAFINTASSQSPPVISAVQWDPIAVDAMQCAIGSGFGPSGGTVTINGVTETAASWSDTQVCTYLRGAGVGLASIQLSNVAGASNAVRF